MNLLALRWLRPTTPDQFGVVIEGQFVAWRGERLAAGIQSN